VRGPASTSIKAAVVVAAMLASADARAQAHGTQALTAAQALHNEAEIALDRGDYASACPKLEEVVRLVPEGIGAKLTLAECYEGAGKLASAWTAYVVAERTAATAKQGAREKLARSRAEALRPRLATLTILVRGAATLSGLEIQRDGVVVGAPQWGSPVPVDKGVHVITATAPGKVRWEKTVEIESDGVTETVTISALEDKAKRPEPVRPAPTQRTQNPPFWRGYRIAGAALGGAGLAAVVGGAIFGLRAMSQKDESNAGGHCTPQNYCDKVGLELRDAGLTSATISTALFVAGGAALAGGVVVFATTPQADESGVQIAIAPTSLALRGQW